MTNSSWFCDKTFEFSAKKLWNLQKESGLYGQNLSFCQSITKIVNVENEREMLGFVYRGTHVLILTVGDCS